MVGIQIGSWPPSTSMAPILKVGKDNPYQAHYNGSPLRKPVMWPAPPMSYGLLKQTRMYSPTHLMHSNLTQNQNIDGWPLVIMKDIWQGLQCTTIDYICKGYPSGIKILYTKSPQTTFPNTELLIWPYLSFWNKNLTLAILATEIKDFCIFVTFHKCKKKRLAVEVKIFTFATCSGILKKTLHIYKICIHSRCRYTLISCDPPNCGSQEMNVYLHLLCIQILYMYKVFF